VLGSTVSPGAGGGSSKRNRKKGKVEDGFSSAGYLSKQDVGKILSKALKVSFPHSLTVMIASSHSLSQ
jgi:EEF1A N-terminal glycine/lysine methyltransferase